MVMDMSSGRQITTLIPSARLELFDGAGHMFWWEEPERTVNLLVHHAKGLTG
jgi:3-oxoadipate enol-lactonase